MPGTQLYTASDAGILFNPYVSNIVYPVPGPALIAGAPSSVAQAVSVATATSSATLPGGDAGGSNPTTAPANPTTTTVRTTLTTSTTSPRPVTTSTTSTAAAPTGGAVQSKWGQCGGIGWTGPIQCVAGSTCSVINAHYSQCV